MTVWSPGLQALWHDHDLVIPRSASSGGRLWSVSAGWGWSPGSADSTWGCPWPPHCTRPSRWHSMTHGQCPSHKFQSHSHHGQCPSHHVQCPSHHVQCPSRHGQCLAHHVSLSSDSSDSSYTGVQSAAVCGQPGAAGGHGGLPPLQGPRAPRRDREHPAGEARDCAPGPPGSGGDWDTTHDLTVTDDHQVLTHQFQLTWWWSVTGIHDIIWQSLIITRSSLTSSSWPRSRLGSGRRTATARQSRVCRCMLTSWQLMVSLLISHQGPVQEQVSGGTLSAQCQGLHPLPVMFHCVLELEPGVRWMSIYYISIHPFLIGCLLLIFHIFKCTFKS